jgi:epoxyqueuosine reductase QueG
MVSSSKIKSAAKDRGADLCGMAAVDRSKNAPKPLSNYISEKGYNLKKCYLCRKICPNHSGLR